MEFPSTSSSIYFYQIELSSVIFDRNEKRILSPLHQENILIYIFYCWQQDRSFVWGFFQQQILHETYQPLCFLFTKPFLKNIHKVCLILLFASD